MKKWISSCLAALMLTTGASAANNVLTAEQQAALTEGTGISVSDVTVTKMEVQQPPAKPEGNPPDGAPMGEPPEGMGMPPGGFNPPQEFTQGTTARDITEDGKYKDVVFGSTGDNENALRVTGAKVSFENITVDKMSGATSNTEAGDFWGQNAAFLATDGADVTISKSVVTSSADNGNGVFSYGEGTKVTVKNTTITTQNDHSGGIQTTGGGATYAENLTVHTSGNSSAAIRSDRGGGTVRVKKGTYETEGYGSPAIYSTADIAVENATLNAKNSEAAVIEGKNSISLKNCTLEGNMADVRQMGENTINEENIHGVMIYQSMSGDAEEGLSSFAMTGGKIISHRGDVIYVTNTACTIDLTNVKITSDDENGALLRVAGNSASRGWGKAGANGGTATVTLAKMKAEGNIDCDTVSTLKLALTKGTVLTGAIRRPANAEGGEATGRIDVTVAKGAVWNLTGDSVVTTLDNQGKVNVNGYVLTVLEK